MKRLITILLSIFSVLLLSAQIQYGYVKTKGRLGADGNVIPGVRLSGATVSIKDRSALISASDGAFSFPLPGKSYIVKNVRKNGYLLTDAEQLRSYGYSSNPLILVMETPEQQNEDRLMAEIKINRTLRSTIRQREEELDSLRAANRITKEEYHKLNAQLNTDEERNRKLIDEMVERYAKMDFDQMDERNREIKACILNGELLKADSLINSKGSLDARIMEYNRLREANSHEAEELKKRSETLASSRKFEEKTLLELAEDCFNKSEVFKMGHQNDSAAYYLAKRAELDTTNVQWQLEAGRFLDDYLAMYNKALDYYNRGLRNALIKYGEKSPDVATCYNNIGAVYSSLWNSIKAFRYHIKSLQILLSFYGEKHPDVATCYDYIGRIYDIYDNDEMALKLYRKALDIRLTINGRNHPSIAVSYDNIASSQSCYTKELEYRNKALDTRLFIYGINHPDVADSYFTIGNLYDSLGDNVSKIEYYNKAKDVWFTLLDENHMDKATCYIKIGNIYLYQRDCTNALEYYNKALDIILSEYGEDDLYIAYCYEKIGHAYDLSDMSGDNVALEYFNKALDIYLDKYGENHIEVILIYNYIGSIYLVHENYSKALECYTKILEIRLKLYGMNNSEVAISYHIIGSIYDMLGNYTKAMDYHKKSLYIYKSLYDYKEINPYAYAINIYETYCRLLQQSDEKKKEFEDFMSEYSFTIDISEGETPALAQSMSGNHYLLELDDWNIYSTKSLYEKITELLGKPKDIVVMKNGVITKYHFENKIGRQIGMKYVGKEEKQRIVESYNKWKKE